MTHATGGAANRAVLPGPAAALALPATALQGQIASGAAAGAVEG